MEKRVRHTLTIDITEEQFFALRKHLPHGSRQVIFHKLINELIEMLKHDTATVVNTFLKEAQREAK